MAEVGGEAPSWALHTQESQPSAGQGSSAPARPAPEGPSTRSLSAPTPIAHWLYGGSCHFVSQCPAATFVLPAGTTWGSTLPCWAVQLPSPGQSFKPSPPKGGANVPVGCQQSP